MSESSSLSRSDILRGLEQLDQYLEKEGVVGELCIFGGACMCLVFSARISTKDVDAVFEPAKIMRKAIFEVGVANQWDWNWINDDVAGFLSASESGLVESKNVPRLSHLKILFPRPEYLLAMKCLSARSGTEDEPSPDLDDALFLCRHLGIIERARIEGIVRDYYPDESLSPNSEFFIEELTGRLIG